MNRIIQPRHTSLVAAAVALAIANSASAQTVLGEITVTARKRLMAILSQAGGTPPDGAETT